MVQPSYKDLLRLPSRLTSIGLIILVNSLSIAQVAPTVEWTKTFGGSGSDWAYGIVQSPDGGYVVAGYSQSTDGQISSHHGSHLNGDYWILKLDSSGALKWERSWGGSYEEDPRSLVATRDGGYIVAGSASSYDGNVVNRLDLNNVNTPDCWVVKFDDAGQIIWSRTLGGNSWDEARCIRQTRDDGFVIAGWTCSTNSSARGSIGGAGVSDYYVAKIDSMGTLQWQNSYGGTGDDAASSIDQTPDGGYIVAGWSSSNDVDVTGHKPGGATYTDDWIVKIDSLGTMQWEKTYGGTGDDHAQCVHVTKDGGFIVAGRSNSTDGDRQITGEHGYVWVFKCDANGTMQWQNNSFSGSGSALREDYDHYSIEETSDGGYVLATHSQVVDKIDALGNLEWEWQNPPADGYSTDVRPTRDGGLIVAGHTSVIPDPSDYQITKLIFIPEIFAEHDHTFALMCDTSMSDTILIQNVGSKSLRLDSAQLAGAAGSFTLTAPLTFPILIPSGSSISIVVKYFAPIVSTASATLNVFSSDTMAAHSPWSIALTGHKDVATPHIVVIDRIDTTICPSTPVVISVPVTNAGREVQVISVSSSVFTLSTVQDTLDSGATDTLILSSAGVASGVYLDTLRITDSCGANHDVAITVHVQQQTPVIVTIATEVAPITVGTIAVLNIIANATAMNAGSNYTFTITNEPTALMFDHVLSPYGITAVPTANAVALSVARGPLFVSDTIATLFYKTLVGSTLAPSLHLFNPSTTNTCQTVAALDSTTINLLPPGCELGTVLVHPFTSSIQSIYPNPATGETTITYSTIEASPVSLVVCDAFGRTVQTVYQGSRTPGVYSAVFDTHQCTNGMYYVVMREGRFSQAWEIFLVR